MPAAKMISRLDYDFDSHHAHNNIKFDKMEYAIKI